MIRKIWAIPPGVVILISVLVFSERLIIARIDSLTLSDIEIKAAEEAASAREAYRKRFEQASTAALNSGLKCDQAIPALSELQTSFAFKVASEARYEAALSTQRLAHGCADCEYALDLKTLVRKKPATP